MKYFGCWREGCDNGLVIQRPFGVCVSFFEFYLKGERWEEKAGCCRGASAGGRCPGDIDRNIKVSFSENKGKQPLGALNAIINISAIFRNFIHFFFIFADECSRSILNDLPPDVTSKMIKTSLDKAGLDK